MCWKGPARVPLIQLYANDSYGQVRRGGKRILVGETAYVSHRQGEIGVSFPVFRYELTLPTDAWRLGILDIGEPLENRLSRLRSTVELLAALAVVASLVFVGIEIRQNSEATRAAATQDLGQSWIDWNLATATREIQEAVVTVGQFADPSEAPMIDQRIAESYARSLFSNWSISHYQYRMGVLDPPLWDAVMRDMGGSVDPAQPFGRLILWAWHRNRHLYVENFTALMDSLAAAGESR